MTARTATMRSEAPGQKAREREHRMTARTATMHSEAPGQKGTRKGNTA